MDSPIVISGPLIDHPRAALGTSSGLRPSPQPPGSEGRRRTRMVTPAHSVRERSFESCQDDIRNRCDTAFLQIKPLLHLRSMTQHTSLTTRGHQTTPTIITGTDENTCKEIYANEGATTLRATLSGHTGPRTWQ